MGQGLGGSAARQVRGSRTLGQISLLHDIAGEFSPPGFEGLVEPDGGFEVAFLIAARHLVDRRLGGVEPWLKISLASLLVCRAHPFQPFRSLRVVRFGAGVFHLPRGDQSFGYFRPHQRVLTRPILRQSLFHLELFAVHGPASGLVASKSGGVERRFKEKRHSARRAQVPIDLRAGEDAGQRIVILGEDWDRTCDRGSGRRRRSGP